MAHSEPLRVADVTGEVARSLNRVDAREFVVERSESKALDARRVHVSQVIVAHLLRVRPQWPIRLLGRGDDQLLDLFLHLLFQDDERAVAGAIRGNRRLREPCAGREAVQIILWPDGAVETGEIETGFECRRRQCRGRCRRGRHGLGSRTSARCEYANECHDDELVEHREPRNLYEGAEYKARSF